MCSSASPNLLLFLLYFISVIAFFSSEWFFLYFLVLWLNSHCVHLFFSHVPLAFLLLMLWTLYLVNYLCSISCFFRVFSYCSIWNKFLFLLILLNFPFLYKTGWHSYLSWFSRGVLVWEHLSAVYMCPVALVGGLDLKWSCFMFFPCQNVLAAITLTGDGADDGETSSRAKCDLELLWCLVVITALSWVVLGPKLLEQIPQGSGQSWFRFL